MSGIALEAFMFNRPQTLLGVSFNPYFKGSERLSKLHPSAYRKGRAVVHRWGPKRRDKARWCLPPPCPIISLTSASLRPRSVLSCSNPLHSHQQCSLGKPCLRPEQSQSLRTALPFPSGRAKLWLKPVRHGPGLPYQGCTEPSNPSPRSCANGLEH